MNYESAKYGISWWKVLLTICLIIFPLEIAADESKDTSSGDLEEVILQLKWYHQFQFAGYYAAAEKGYYRDAGLDVKIVEGGPFDTVAEVLSSHAKYGVSNTDILLWRLQGKPLVVLAAVFQHSPCALMVRRDSDIHDPHDLLDRRVRMTRGTRDAELHAMFRSEGVPLERVQTLADTMPNVDYSDQTIDAFGVYITKEPFYMEQKNIPVSLICPRTYGIDFYGDCLYTAEEELKKHPDRVKRFRAASLKGWEYAMQNPEEIIDVILAKYGSKMTREHLQYEASKMRDLVMPDLVEMGHMNPGRWRHIADTYAQLGMVEPGYSLEGFIYDPYPKPDYTRAYWLIGIVTSLLLLAAVASIILWFFNRRLKAAVHQRTIELGKSNEMLKESQNRNEAIIRAIPDMMLKVDRTGKFLEFIPAEDFEPRSSPDEFLGKKMSEIMPAEMAERNMYYIEQALQDGELKQYEYKLPLGDDIRDYEARVVACGEDEVLIIIRDITERKRAGEALKESEERWRSLVENAPATIATLDRNGILLFISRTSPDLSVEEVIGTSAYDYLPPEEHSRFSQILESIFQTGEKEKFELETTGSDGTKIWYDNRVAPIRVGDQVVAALYISTDITERKQVEEALRESEELYHNLYETMAQGVVYLNAEGEMTSANPAAERILGLTLDQIQGRTPADPRWRAIHEDGSDFPGDTHPIMVALETGKEVNDVIMGVYSPEHQEHRWVLINAVPKFRQGEDKPYEVYATFDDITDLKRAEEELLKAKKLESVGILAGGIAHDFNNLLTGILGNISLAEMYAEIGKPSSEVLERLKAAEEACMRSKDLAQQLLTFSSGGVPIRKTAAIAKLLKDSATLASSGSNIMCEFYISDDLWLVEMDEGQMNQVIGNIIINADQAMASGGIVEVSAENVSVNAEDGLSLEDGKYVKISIEDHGIGIPEADLPKIFDPYFTTKQTGSGLGLAICYSIVDKHGGYITAKSRMGIGTTLHIYLPASLEEVSIEEESREENMPIMGEGSVLLMDDEEIVRGIAGDMIRDFGYNIAVAVDGSETIELYKSAMESGHTFDAVILDLTIAGGMGGKETIQKLIEIDPEVKAVVSSGYSNNPVMTDFGEYGFKGVIAKPYKAVELSEVLHNVIAGT